MVLRVDVHARVARVEEPPSHSLQSELLSRLQDVVALALLNLSLVLLLLVHVLPRPRVEAAVLDIAKILLLLLGGSSILVDYPGGALVAEDSSTA